MSHQYPLAGPSVSAAQLETPRLSLAGGLSDGAKTTKPPQTQGAQLNLNFK